MNQEQTRQQYQYMQQQQQQQQQQHQQQQQQQQQGSQEMPGGGYMRQPAVGVHQQRVVTSQQMHNVPTVTVSQPHQFQSQNPPGEHNIGQSMNFGGLFHPQFTNHLTSIYELSSFRSYFCRTTPIDKLQFPKSFVSFPSCSWISKSSVHWWTLGSWICWRSEPNFRGTTGPSLSRYSRPDFCRTAWPNFCSPTWPDICESSNLCGTRSNFCRTSWAHFHPCRPYFCWTPRISPNGWSGFSPNRRSGICSPRKATESRIGFRISSEDPGPRCRIEDAHFKRSQKSNNGEFTSYRHFYSNVCRF